VEVAMALLVWLPHLLLGMLPTAICLDEVDPTSEFYLPISEISEMTPHQLKALLQEADADKSGEVTKAEFLDFLAKWEELLSRENALLPSPEVDRDGDGAISEDEMLKDIKSWEMETKQELNRVRKLEKEKFRLADEDGDKQLKGEEIGSMYAPHPYHKGVLNALTRSEFLIRDLNNDGQLTEKEFWYDYLRPDEEEDDYEEDELAERSATFKGLDVDGNSKVDMTEMQAWQSGLIYLKLVVDKVFALCDADGNQQASFEELLTAWPTIDETGAAMHISNVLDRTLQELKARDPENWPTWEVLDSVEASIFDDEDADEEAELPEVEKHSFDEL